MWLFSLRRTGKLTDHVCESGETMSINIGKFVQPTCLLMICFCTIASPNIASAQTLESLKDGFRSERELFRSGRYRMTGTFKRKAPKSDRKMGIAQEFSGFVAVDHDAR
jgi:hypothetical protein